jgi:hypothetical protein
LFQFDYLIAFPLVEGPFAGDFGDPNSRATWKEVALMWRSAVPGTDDVKQAALGVLAVHWEM